MALRIEIFAAGQAPPDAVWAVVGDPRRWPEWTDADRVELVDAEPLRPGGRVVTIDGGRRLAWTVLTAEARLLEAETDLGRGRLGIGVRVAPDPAGCRVILAGALQPAGRLAALRGALMDAPALRRRFDRWCHAALRAAG